MKGSTHLTIGTVIGIAAAAYFPFTFKNAALYISVAAFSALSADLDGASMLSSKLGSVAKLLRLLALWAGPLLVASVAYMYFRHNLVYPEFTAVSVITLLLGFVTKEGIIRNALVSMIGCGLIYLGFTSKMNWLIGFGLFVAWVPWLNHRGMTHTVWAVMLWGAIGWGLEKQLQLDGITAVSVCGYLSHLLADTLTPNGVKWLFPLYNKSIKLPLR